MITPPGVSFGWSQSGKLITTDPNTKVSMQAGFHEAGNYTVQLDITPPVTIPSSNVSNGVYAAVAEIYWSVKGNTIRRLVSVGNGTSVSGVGEAVKVIVSDVSAFSPGYPGLIKQQYTVFINVAKGIRPTVNRPAVLIYPPLKLDVGFSTLGPGIGTIFQVPQNAGVISANVSVSQNGPIPLTTPTVSINQSNPAFGQFKRYNPVLEPGFVSIEPGVTVLSINNNSVGDTYNTDVLWGIDG